MVAGVTGIEPVTSSVCEGRFQPSLSTGQARCMCCHLGLFVRQSVLMLAGVGGHLPSVFLHWSPSRPDTGGDVAVLVGATRYGRPHVRSNDP
jgi:hypothetical protein